MKGAAKGTRKYKRHICFVLFVFLCAFCGPLLFPRQLPFDPIHDSGQSVTGAFEGWFKNNDGSFSLLVGYFNRNQKQTLDIPLGPDNHIDPGGPDRDQPTHFLPRRQWGVFTVTVPKDFGDKKLTWTITANGKTTSIPMSLNPLWIVEPYKDAGVGNTPPIVRFRPEGPAFAGPPRGIAESVTAKPGDAWPLILWVADDVKQPPEPRPRRGPLSRIFWRKFRDPDPVSFQKPRPPVYSEGKAATTATFSTPGEYI